MEIFYVSYSYGYYDRKRKTNRNLKHTGEWLVPAKSAKEAQTFIESYLERKRYKRNWKTVVKLLECKVVKS